MNDAVRAAIIAVANALFPVLQIAGIVDLTGDEVAQVMVFITSLVVLIGLFVKNGQQPGPPA